MDALKNLCAFVLVAVGVVALPIEQGASGGDRPGNFVIVGASAIVGGLASLVYSRLERDPSRAERVRLAAWTFIRFFLAFELVRFGTAKIVGMQFFERYSLLDSRVVDLKPSLLAWAFFGHSYAYQAFSGALEITAAVLLCFRRTTLFGACVLLAVMSNVVLVNFAFGISVKLFSSVYLAMTLYLLGLEGRRFWTFFFGDGAVAKPPRKKLAIVKALAVLLVLVVPAWSIVREASQHRLFTKEPILGAWSVDQGTGLDGVLADASAPWEKIYFEKGDYGFVRIGKQRIRFDMKADEPAQTLSLSMFGGRDDAPTLDATFERREHKMHIQGLRAGKPFSLDLTRDFPR